ncbi:MAG: hypothetical protein WBD40_02460 [Tepidisphaeraceae bacterium]
MRIPAACSSGGDDGGDDEANERKAKVFFSRGRDVADTGNYEYAIEMYLQGLLITPENVAAHRELREIALKRKADGGKDLGMLEKMKLDATLANATDDKQAMLLAEKLLAHDPGKLEWMVAAANRASRAGFPKAAEWFAELARKAAGD